MRAWFSGLPPQAAVPVKSSSSFLVFFVFSTQNAVAPPPRSAGFAHLARLAFSDRGP